MIPSWLLVATKSAGPAGLAGELTGPIVWKDEAKRIVYGPVLIPDEPDTDGDVVTAEKIEEVAHRFLKDYGTIDVQHTLNHVGRPVESYVAPQDLWFDTADGRVIVPKGSWILGVYVEDDFTWDRVMRGELTGYSIMAVSRAKAVKEQQPKRVTLRDLGDGWVAVAVSLVHRPAVPAAKWVAIKSKAKVDPPVDLTPVQRTVAALLGIPVASSSGPMLSTKHVGLLRTAHEALGQLIGDIGDGRSNTTAKGDNEVNKDELTQVLKEEIAAAVRPIADRLGQVETTLKGLQPADGKEAGAPAATTPTGEQADPALKELLTKLDERLQTVEKELAVESRQPSGQDGPGTPPVTKAAQAPTRDAFGRRIRIL